MRFAFRCSPLCARVTPKIYPRIFSESVGRRNKKVSKVALLRTFPGSVPLRQTSALLPLRRRALPGPQTAPVFGGALICEPGIISFWVNLCNSGNSMKQYFPGERQNPVDYSEGLNHPAVMPLDQCHGSPRKTLFNCQ